MMEVEEGDNQFETRLKTSHLKIGLGGCLKEHKKPFAVLRYNNIEILIPYTYLQNLELELNNMLYRLDESIFALAKNEMLTEMRYDMNHKDAIGEDAWHRDNPQNCTLNHSWQSIQVRLRDRDYIETDCKIEPDYGKDRRNEQ